MSYCYDYPRPMVAVDLVILTVEDRDLKVFLPVRTEDPFCGIPALPGGFLLEYESLDDAVLRILRKETKFKDVFFEQLYTFGSDPHRDPRGHVLSVAYYALIPPNMIPLPEESHHLIPGYPWYPTRFFNGKITLSFDHDKIISTAVRRIQGKIDYAPQVAKNLVPEEFTVAELHVVYDAVKGVTSDRSNFTKKVQRMAADNLLKKTGRRAEGRTASLYKFLQLE